MAEAPGSRTQPPRVGGERPILKTGRATGPHSLPSLHYREERRGSLLGFGGAEGGTPNGRPIYLAWDLGGERKLLGSGPCSPATTNRMLAFDQAHFSGTRPLL